MQRGMFLSFIFCLHSVKAEDNGLFNCSRTQFVWLSCHDEMFLFITSSVWGVLQITFFFFFIPCFGVGWEILFSMYFVLCCCFHFIVYRDCDAFLAYLSMLCWELRWCMHSYWPTGVPSGWYAIQSPFAHELFPLSWGIKSYNMFHWLLVVNFLRA